MIFVIRYKDARDLWKVENGLLILKELIMDGIGIEIGDWIDCRL
jgi:hypothetical protein